MNGEGLRVDKRITCIQTIDGAISTWFHRPDASQHTHWEAETVGSVRANCTASSVASEQDVTHRTAAPKLTKLWADPMARRAPPVAVADERRLAVAGTALRTRAESIVSRKCEQKRYSRQFRAGDSQQQHLWDSGMTLLSSHFHTDVLERQGTDARLCPVRQSKRMTTRRRYKIGMSSSQP